MPLVFKARLWPWQRAYLSDLAHLQPLAGTAATYNVAMGRAEASRGDDRTATADESGALAEPAALPPLRPTATGGSFNRPSGSSMRKPGDDGSAGTALPR